MHRWPNRHHNEGSAACVSPARSRIRESSCWGERDRFGGAGQAASGWLPRKRALPHAVGFRAVEVTGMGFGRCFVLFGLTWMLSGTPWLPFRVPP